MEGIDYSVKYLQDIKFDRLIFSEKVEIKRSGRLTPPLSLEQASSSNGRSYTRQFNIAMYDKHEWLCGCQYYNAVSMFIISIVFHVYKSSKCCSRLHRLELLRQAQANYGDSGHLTNRKATSSNRAHMPCSLYCY